MISHEIPSLANASAAIKASLIIFPIVVSFWSRTGNPTFYDLLGLSSTMKLIICYVYKYTVPVLGILAVYVFFDWLIRYKFLFKKSLQALGKLSLEIYSANACFLNFMYLIGSVLLPIRIIVAFTIALFGSLLIQYLIKKVKFLSVIFYGK